MLMTDVLKIDSVSVLVEVNVVCASRLAGVGSFEVFLPPVARLSEPLTSLRLMTFPFSRKLWKRRGMVNITFVTQETYRLPPSLCVDNHLSVSEVKSCRKASFCLRARAESQAQPSSPDRAINFPVG